MELRIVHEAGHVLAVTGMQMSYQPECRLKDIQEAQYVSTAKNRLRAGMDGGHNKFLESIIVWVDMRMSMKMWKQFDTYRLCTKQSKSTMHTLLKRPLTQADFDAPVSVGTLATLNEWIRVKAFEEVCDNLPMSFLQTRRVCLSYKTIRNIILQRQSHKLPEWRDVCSFFLKNLHYPELLGITDDTQENLHLKD